MTNFFFHVVWFKHVEILFSCQLCTVWKPQCGKTRKFLSLKKKFRQINYLVISLLKHCFHEIFSKKVWEWISAISTLWKRTKYAQKFSEFNFLVSSLVKTLIWREKMLILRKNRDRVLQYFSTLRYTSEKWEQSKLISRFFFKKWWE